MCLLTETRALSAQGEKRALVGNLTMPRQGPALQPAIGLFFAGGKEAIEINVQLFRGGGLPHPRTIANT